jgi:membrane associated rhomboid family serine protease
MDRDRVSTWLLRSGAVLFAIGLVFAVLTFFPFLLGRDNTPLGIALATMLSPLGFGVALLALVREAGVSRRAARQK